MDLNISYKFDASFTYHSGGSASTLIGSIYEKGWTPANKYAYWLRGSPYKSASERWFRRWLRIKK